MRPRTVPFGPEHPTRRDPPLCVSSAVDANRVTSRLGATGRFHGVLHPISRVYKKTMPILYDGHRPLGAQSNGRCRGCHVRESSDTEIVWLGIVRTSHLPLTAPLLFSPLFSLALSCEHGRAEKRKGKEKVAAKRKACSRAPREKSRERGFESKQPAWESPPPLYVCFFFSFLFVCKALQAIVSRSLLIDPCREAAVHKHPRRWLGAASGDDARVETSPDCHRG